MVLLAGRSTVWFVFRSLPPDGAQVATCAKLAPIGTEHGSYYWATAHMFTAGERPDHDLDLLCVHTAEMENAWGFTTIYSPLCFGAEA